VTVEELRAWITNHDEGSRWAREKLDRPIPTLSGANPTQSEEVALHREDAGELAAGYEGICWNPAGPLPLALKLNASMGSGKNATGGAHKGSFHPEGMTDATEGRDHASNAGLHSLRSSIDTDSHVLPHTEAACTPRGEFSHDLESPGGHKGQKWVPGER